MSPIAEWLPPCMECLPSSPKAAIKAWQKQNKKRTHAHNTTNNNKKHRWRCYATAHMQNNFQADYCRWWCCSDWWCLTDRRWVCAKQVGGCQLSVVVVVVVIIVVFFWRQPIVGVLCQRGITLDSRWQKINKKKNEIIKKSLKILKSHKHLAIVVIWKYYYKIYSFLQISRLPNTEEV